MSEDIAEYEKEQRAEAAHKRAMEKLAAEERIERVKADAEVKKTRSENRPISVGVIAALLVMLAIVGGLTYGCTQPADPNNPDRNKDQIEQIREESCIESGGGWLPEDLVATGDDGVCVYPGERKS